MVPAERETIPFDVLFVGAGPASLAGAIHLARLVKKWNEGVKAGRAPEGGKPLAAEIGLPAVQPGSSIMPGKVNPSIVECMNMICLHAIGADATVAAAAGAGNLDLNVMMPVIAFDLLLAVDTMRAGVDMLTERCIRGITADAERCRAYLEKGVGSAAILNPVIGYVKAGEIAKEAAATGRTIKEVAVARGVITEAQWSELFHPDRIIKPGNAGPGGGG